MGWFLMAIASIVLFIVVGSIFGWSWIRVKLFGFFILELGKHTKKSEMPKKAKDEGKC